MERKENGDLEEEGPASPYQVLQQLSEEAVRVAGEALHSVYVGTSNLPPRGSRHRRTRSEVVATSVNRRSSSNNFQRWKSHMQRALRWGSNMSNQSSSSPFNPEILANQKRQWYQLHSKTLDHKRYSEPTRLFEHFIIAGLHPDVNLETVEDAFVRRKKWEVEMEKSEGVDFQTLQHYGPSLPTLEPQILFKYPPAEKLSMRLKDLAAFCFPGGVKARVLERTPSFSELNEIVYGQGHLSRDDLSFIFCLRVADYGTLYGVCLHVQEIVQRPPAIFGTSSPLSRPSVGSCRFLVSAPRCYCVLTRVPFFELHYEMLNSIIAQERLNRITQFVTEMAISDYLPSPKLSDQMNGSTESPCGELIKDWAAAAIPVDNAIALTAAAAGIISDDEVPSTSSRWEPFSPESIAASEAFIDDQASGSAKDDNKNMQMFDDCSLEPSDSHNGIGERSNRMYYDASEVGMPIRSNNRTLERIGSFESLFSCSTRSIASEDEDDDIYISHDRDAGDATILEWARENKSYLLEIVCSYHSMPLPERGNEIVFLPLEHLQPIAYRRPSVSALGLSEEHLYPKMHDQKEAAQVNLKLAAAEEAVALSIWTTATICRVLSLENILALVTGVLLEKQVVVVCPNLGVLSAMVLSLIPMIRPFEWQSLFLPILPTKMLDFLEAPVPFIVGIQQKPDDLKIRTSNLVYVNVVKDQVKMCSLPVLPRRKELTSELAPIHARLSCEDFIAKRHPVYKCNEMQADAAAQFLSVMKRYLESLCTGLRSHTITSVQSNEDRVSILLKESFIDSFPSRDQPFIKLLAETQLFSVLSDFRLTSYENEY